MITQLTENQKKLLRWLVDKINEKYLDEEFIVTWTETGKGFYISDSKGKKKEQPEKLTKALLDILEKEGLIYAIPQYRTSRDKVEIEDRRDCTITQKAYDLVGSNFQSPDLTLKKKKHKRKIKKREKKWNRL